MKVSLCILISCLCGLFITGCNSNSAPYVVKIVDMASDEPVSLELLYDNEGRLVRLGGASFVYRGDEIIVENLSAMLGYGDFTRIVYKLSNGRVKASDARCKEVIFGDMTEVNKKTAYSYSSNKIIMESKSFNISDNKLLKSVHEVREYGQDGKLLSVKLSDSDHGNGVMSYKYDSNLTCSANINLQAFYYTANGLDEMIVNLLNLNKVAHTNILPDEVCYTYQSGVTHIYNENSCLDGDRLTKMEVMLNYETLVSRLNFEYKQ